MIAALWMQKIVELGQGSKDVQSLQIIMYLQGLSITSLSLAEDNSIQIFEDDMLCSQC
jgi:hypothetical protein